MHTHTHTHTQTHTRTHAHTHEHMHIHSHTHTHTHIDSLKQTAQSHIQTHMHTHPHPHTHTRTHTNTRMFTHTNRPPRAICTVLHMRICRALLVVNQLYTGQNLQHAQGSFECPDLLCCNTLQHTAAHFSTLQRTASHCNTPRPDTGLFRVSRLALLRATH